ncbi:MAG: NOL1/NOP2/sun family putative RNA methylase [Candidatus Woesearchaeota archaeon]
MLKPRYDVDLSSKPRKALRVNTLKISVKELVQRLEIKGVELEKIPFLETGFFYESSFSLASSPEYLQGFIYLQDGASQLVATILNPSKGDVVLDMAASPGSKTTHLAQLMDNKGIIYALDVKRERLQALINNCERLSVLNVVSLIKDARFASDLGLEFDKVLLDAPCSGNYCNEPNYYKKRTIEDLKGRAKLQKELVKEAFKVLKKGGSLVYSTCSLEPEEDEEVVEFALSLGFKLDKLDVLGEDTSVEGTKKLFPHIHGVEPFFVARLKK